MNSSLKITKNNGSDTSNSSLNNFFAGRYPTMREVGHHFKAKKALDQIESSMDNLVGRTKAELQISGSMNSQLQQSINDFGSTLEQTADQEIDKELNVSTSRREILSTKYFVCLHCNQKILNRCQREHFRICDGVNRSKEKTDTNKCKDNQNVEIIAVQPHPLRNLRLIGVSFDAIKISWDLPIFDGGETLVDFEISYCCESFRKRARAKRVSMSCLRWCNKVPLCGNSFILDGLSAATQYTGIRMRCKNRIGWSDYSTPIDCVKTGDPINPLPPQRFEINDISSNSISFSWSPPFHCGGGNILEYDLTYEEEVPAYNQAAGMSKQGSILTKKAVKIQKGQTRFSLTGLPGDTSLHNICLRVTNSFGLLSDCVTCGNAKTCKPSREQIIREEILRVTESAEEEIDSDFFQPGILQREEKSTYLMKLEDLLRHTLRDDEANSTPSNNGNISIIDDQQQKLLMDENTEMNNPFEMRQRNFDLRINSLKKYIEENRKSCDDHNKNRVFWVRNMQQTQDRIYLLQAELNTLVDCKEEYTSSNVLNGTTQKMKTDDLRTEVQNEINEKMESISAWKLKIISGDRECAKLNDRIKTNDEELKDRLAAYNSFKMQLKSVSRIKLRTSKCTKESLQHIMTSWLQLTRHSKQRSLAIDMTANVIHHGLLVRSMKTWQASVRRESSSPIDFNQPTICGRGGRMLSNVLVERQRACDEVKSTIVDLKRSSDRFLPGERDIDLSKLPQKLAFEITRGDYYHNIQQYDVAIKIYLIVLEGISNEIPIDNFFYCAVEEKIAYTYMKASLWNNSILHLDSIINQAKFSQCQEFIPCAEILLGECYLNIGEFESAKESFFDGLKLVEGTDCHFLLTTAYKGLAHYYEYVDDQPRHHHYIDLYNSLSCKVKDKINTALMKANDLQNVLMDTSLRKGKIVHFQNVSFQYVEAKSKVKILRDSITEKTTKRHEYKKEIEDQQQLIQRIEKEINVCISSGETMQTSSLVHDNSQKIETVELVERLELRKKLCIKSLQKFIEREIEISFQIKNMNDELLGILEDLNLEQGQLMQKVLKKRLIRCMTFNTLNKSGIDAYGRKNWGRPLIILTIDTDIYVYDLKEGQLRHVFIGGKDDSNKEIVGHTSTITSIYYFGDKIYSGSFDKTVRCWNAEKGCLEFVATGHLATVTSICVNCSTLFTGSTDKYLILWNAQEGYMISRFLGHSRGITSLHCGSSWCLSGDVDGELFVWRTNKEVNTLSRKLRLQANEKITVIRCSNLEIICGDAAGNITIWWLENGEILQQNKVHDKSITDLQFDATVLVTCSLDTTLKVIDVTTCQVLQTVRGHSSPVLSICFDRIMVLSLSTDGTMKQWLWQSHSGSNKSGDVFHTFTEGDTLQQVCEQYNVTMKDLLKWNLNRDIKKITIGQRLIVIKGSIEKETKRNQELLPMKRDILFRKDCSDNFSSSKKDLTSLASRLARKNN